MVYKRNHFVNIWSRFKPLIIDINRLLELAVFQVGHNRKKKQMVLTRVFSRKKKNSSVHEEAHDETITICIYFCIIKFYLDSPDFVSLDRLLWWIANLWAHSDIHDRVHASPSPVAYGWIRD